MPKRMIRRTGAPRRVRTPTDRCAARHAHNGWGSGMLIEHHREHGEHRCNDAGREHREHGEHRQYGQPDSTANTGNTGNTGTETSARPIRASRTSRTAPATSSSAPTGNGAIPAAGQGPALTTEARPETPRGTRGIPATPEAPPPIPANREHRQHREHGQRRFLLHPYVHPELLERYGLHRSVRRRGMEPFRRPAGRMLGPRRRDRKHPREHGETGNTGNSAANTGNSGSGNSNTGSARKWRWTAQYAQQLLEQHFQSGLQLRVQRSRVRSCQPDAGAVRLAGAAGWHTKRVLQRTCNRANRGDRDSRRSTR